MTCRSCGITIADKAIVCFKCGTPTADLVSTPRTVSRPANKLWQPMAFTLVLSALGVWLIPKTDADSWMRMGAWAALAIAACGVLLVSIRVSRGRRSGRLSRK